jgi:chromosome partitioning protein
MSHVISVTNQKGGVGKTTTAVNLASGLAHLGKNVLLIDFDPQGHATEHLGGRTLKNPELPTVLEALTQQMPVRNCIYQSYIPKLKLLGSNLRLGQFNQMPPVGNQFKLSEILTQDVHQEFDFIIIDCQPSLSLLTLNTLTAADYVLLPVQAEFFALDGLSQLVITLKDVQTKLHPKLQVLGILLTMFDARNRLSTEVYNELKRNFGGDIFETVIPRNVKLAEAPSFSQSIFEYDRFCSGAQAYGNLCNEVLTKVT